jgi:hypothetical protein
MPTYEMRQDRLTICNFAGCYSQRVMLVCNLQTETYSNSDCYKTMCTCVRRPEEYYPTDRFDAFCKCKNVMGNSTEFHRRNLCEFIQDLPYTEDHISTVLYFRICSAKKFITCLSFSTRNILCWIFSFSFLQACFKKKYFFFHRGSTKTKLLAICFT